MKIEEFSKYKSLVESNDFSEIENYPGAERVYHWMEKSGRLDEGILQSMWSWIKKHFSIRSKRLHDLADEYEAELMKEGEAEWNKTKDKLDLAAKYRANNFTRLSRDIEERMEIIAGDDDDYRELVKVLINKKNMKVKKQLLQFLLGKMDPTEPDYDKVKSYYTEGERNYAEGEREYEKVAKKMSKAELDKIDDVLRFMENKIKTDDRVFYQLLGLKGKEEIAEYVRLLWYYLKKIKDAGTEIELNQKSVYSLSKKYVEAVKEVSKKLKSDGEDIAVKAAIKTINRELKLKKPNSFDKIKTNAYREASRIIDDSEEEKYNFRDDIEGEDTDEFMDDEEKEEAVTASKKASSKGHPSGKTLKGVIEKAVKTHFASSGNISDYVDSINSSVEKFNNLTTAERKKKAKEYDYDLLPDFKIKEVDSEEVKNLLDSFIDIAGIIYPYYELSKDGEDDTIALIEQFLMEIHAIKKDASKKLVEKERDKLIENMKKKYPDQFK